MVAQAEEFGNVLQFCSRQRRNRDGHLLGHKVGREGRQLFRFTGCHLGAE